MVEPTLIGVGLSTGKVVLCSFRGGSRILKEFTPKHSRTCNSLSWNPIYTNQLAVGLDKVRGDSSTLVWDVNSLSSDTIPSNSTVSTSIDYSTLNISDSISKPMSEFASSEATVSLAWMPSSPHCLATGTGVKWLRIYDLRGDLNAPQSVVAHAKSVHGVSFDPFKPERLVTFSEDGIIKLWDIRNFTDSIFTFNSNSKGLSQLEWCPTRSGVLATIAKDEKQIKFWDIKDSLAIKSESIIKPCRIYDTSEAISCISWDVNGNDRLITLYSNTSTIDFTNLPQPMPLTYNPHSNIAIAKGKYLVEFEPSKDSSPDISTLMKQRALDGYSMDISNNKKILENSTNKHLKLLWDWMLDYYILNTLKII